MAELEEDDLIKAYVEQVIKIQQESGTPSQEELDKVAADLGMTDVDVEKLRKRFKDYLTRGQGYSRYEDWESAIEELEQAVVLNPASIDALYGLASAYKQRYLIKKSKSDLQKAKTMAKRSLELNPSHDPSLKLISQINKGTLTYRDRLTLNDNLPSKPNWKGLSKKKKSTLPDLYPDNQLVRKSKYLRKSPYDRKISGVCAGLAEYFGIDPAIVRAVFAGATIFSSGSFIPVYIILALVMPNK